MILVNLRIFIFLKNCIGLAALSILGSGLAIAESSRSVYLPLIFDSGQIVKSSACLQVTEHVYPQTVWWEKDDGKVTSLENAFKAMISATKNKNKAALFELTDLTQRSDAKSFYRDVEQFFKWREKTEQIAVTRSYEFDNLVVFPVQIKQADKINYLIFLFTKNIDGTFSFLPYGSTQLNYLIVNDFLNSKWGLTNSDGPEYCTKEQISRATHRISLSTAPTKNLGSSSSYLYFSGTTLKDSEVKNKFAKQVQSTIKDIKVALSSPDRKGLDAFINHLTPSGGKGLKEWFVSASESELDGYKHSIIEQNPIFLIDASPLVVVYTKSQSGSLHEMFFMSDANNELLWTHSSHITNSTKVFTSGPLRDAVLEKKPFDSSLIK